MGKYEGWMEIKEYIADPKTGIEKSVQAPIIRLLEYAFEGKVIGRYWMRKWKQLGRITPEGKVSWDGTGIDLILMALEWQGFVVRVKAN